MGEDEQRCTTRNRTVRECYTMPCLNAEELLGEPGNAEALAELWPGTKITPK